MVKHLRTMSEISMLTLLLRASATVKNRNGDPSLHGYVETEEMRSQMLHDVSDTSNRDCSGLRDPAGISHGQGWGAGKGWNICALGKPAPAVRVARAHCGPAPYIFIIFFHFYFTVPYILFFLCSCHTSL